MRVLLVTGSYPPLKCGVGAYTMRLAEALSARREHHRIMVLTSDGARESPEHAGVELHVVKGWGLANVAGLVRKALSLRPDIVHIQFPTQGYRRGLAIFLLPAMLRFIGLPVVQTWHEPIEGKVRALPLAVGASALVSVRGDVRSRASRALRWLLEDKSIEWIPAGAMLPVAVLTDYERARIKARYASGGDILLVFYGFIAPLKGLETLLEVVAAGGFKLVLASDLRREDPYHESLAGRIRTLALQERVEVIGFQPEAELAMLLGSADAAVFPFSCGAAPWNTSIDGAVAQGVFVVTTTKGATGYDAARHTYSTIPGDADEMVRVLRTYAGKRRNGAGVTERRWDNIAESHYAIYRKLLAQ